MFTSSESGSIPDLASSESWSSEADNELETDHDSGVSDSLAGNVTDLSRRRRIQAVRRGVITETGPYIPASLGLSFCEADSDGWEEVLDTYGNPTGVERLSFRLNINNGRTESIDEDLTNVLRMNGMNDGTNCRRVAGGNGEGWREYDEVLDINNVWEVTDESSNYDGDLMYQLNTTDEQEALSITRCEMRERYHDDELEVYGEDMVQSSIMQGGCEDEVERDSEGLWSMCEYNITGGASCDKMSGFRGLLAVDERMGCLLQQILSQLPLWVILGVMVVCQLVCFDTVRLITDDVNSPGVDSRVWGECGATLGGVTSEVSCPGFQQFEALGLDIASIGDSGRNEEDIEEVDLVEGGDDRIHVNGNSCLDMSDSDDPFTSK